MFSTQDTIAAISTAAGSADRAIVRVSGPRAVEIAASIFTPSACQCEHPQANGSLRVAPAQVVGCEGQLGQCPGFRWVEGLVRLPAARPQFATRNANSSCDLPAIAYIFRGPRSYTRQDLCELHIPGPAVAANWLLETLLSAGARQAQAGEFTARAFFSGRIDLSAAEGVADIIDAASRSQLRAGLVALGGHVHRFCQSASEELAEMLAGIEASIDLADENIHLESPVDLSARLAALAQKMDGFAGQAADIPDQAREAQVVIAGRPNAGKSSLLNALVGADRAIVSDLAGTTRDVISATLELADQCVLMQDLAGLETAGDDLSAAGQSAARRAIASADAIVFVFDLLEGDLTAQVDLFRTVQSANPQAAAILLANKADRLHGAALESGLGQIEARAGSRPIAISALGQTGLDEVRRALVARLSLEVHRGGEAMGLHLRQKNCLRSAAEAARRGESLLAGVHGVADVAELAAIELRLGLAELGQISGQVVTEDILGRIFRRFCVGK